MGAAVAICIFALSHTNTPELNFQWVLDLQKVHKLETPFKSSETWFCKQGEGSADEEMDWVRIERQMGFPWGRFPCGVSASHVTGVL